jgi:hypothetical protein
MSEEQGKFSINLSGGNRLYYALKSAKKVKIYTNTQTIETIEDNKIQELTIGNYKLKVGDDFEHEVSTIPSAYEVNYITKDEMKGFNYCYAIHSHLENKTSQFILPCLGWTIRDIQYNGYLVNTYLTKEPNVVALLYRFSTYPDYGVLETNLSRFKGFVNIDASIKGYDLVLMEVLPKYVKDLHLFSQGSYSKLSNDLKEKIVSFHGLKEKDKLWQIIYKGNDLMGKIKKEFGLTTDIAELESKPKMSEELLGNQSFIKLIHER